MEGVREVRWRRRLLLAAGGGILVTPNWAWPQAGVRSYRLGWLATSDSFREPYGLAFVHRLGELGFVEGRNLTIDRRHADNRLERMPQVAAELGKLKHAAYFGGGAEASLAALAQASPSTPIVFVAVDFDPVATGDVASLARPGGRVTGISAQQSVLPAKRVELLREMFPGMKKLAVFTNEQTTAQLALTQGTARRLGIALHVVDFKRPPFDFERGFAEAVSAKPDALFVFGSGLFVTARKLIPTLALKAKLPTMFHQAQWVEEGGLMSYGYNFPAMWRRGADMVAKVFNGEKPGNIPMEQPTNYELAVNLKTAAALGVKVPQVMRLRADKVIE